MMRARIHTTNTPNFCKISYLISLKSNKLHTLILIYEKKNQFILFPVNITGKKIIQLTLVCPEPPGNVSY